MIIDHPVWQKVLPYLKPPSKGRQNFDFSFPADVRAEALAVRVECVACRKMMAPFRARKQGSTRSRVVGTATEGHIFYSGACPGDRDKGCSRTGAAKQHKKELLEVLGFKDCTVSKRGKLAAVTAERDALRLELEDALQSLRIAGKIYEEEHTR